MKEQMGDTSRGGFFKEGIQQKRQIKPWYRNVDMQEAVHVCELSVLSTQFCGEAKSAIKIKPIKIIML